MPILPLQLYKDYLMIGSKYQDDVIKTLAESAEDYVARYCEFRFSSDANTIPIIEIVDSENGFIKPKVRPILTIQWIKDLSTDSIIPNFIHTKLFIQGNFVDAFSRYKICYFGGYILSTLPAGIKSVMLELARQYYLTRDAGTINIESINGMLSPYKMQSGVA